MGYGKLEINGKTVSAHRTSYAIEHGSIPSGMIVMHACDNRRCVRPSHLSAGTQLENMHDMIAKGRAVTVLPEPKLGSSHHNAKLSELDVREIHRLASIGDTSHKAMSVMFGVSRSLVSLIVKGRAWAHMHPSTK